ncbi:hypothetical protein N9Q04_03855 [Burkholderiales bacterium]|jgi:hypothetical protein|nr:hypothetical protein [Burkholderiales bacterium]
MLIRHITTKQNFSKMAADGLLKLELCLTEDFMNDESFRDAPLHVQTATLDNWERNQKTFKLLGRHVWFTAQRDARTSSTNHIDASERVALVFDSNEIGAKSWIGVTSKLKGSAKKLARVYNFSAQLIGDDWREFWVTDKPISLNHLKAVEYLDSSKSSSPLAHLFEASNAINYDDYKKAA